MIRYFALLHACFTPWCAGAAPQAAEGFELRDGDRVVFVGNTFIEREQAYGCIEAMLTARWPDRNITFRNLGWSGDTVWGDARAGFDSPAEGFKRLVEAVHATNPTVIFVGYGMNESFEGDSGLRRFVDGLVRLVDELGKTGARIILLSPTPHEDLGPPFPDAAAHNRDLAKYVEAMQVFCWLKDYTFVDLFTYHLAMENRRGPSRMAVGGTPRTVNGIHLQPFAYLDVAWEINAKLKIWPLEASKKMCDRVIVESYFDMRIDRFVRITSGYQFDVTFYILPWTPESPLAQEDPWYRWFQLRGLPDGRYEVRVDGKRAAGPEGTLESSRRSTSVVYRFEDPDFAQKEQLRQAIIEKNRLYFHRWRPQNETYLFGFRKHEQGQNAAEVPQFDPLVEEQEKLIAKLRVPVKHTYELIREKEGGD